MADVDFEEPSWEAQRPIDSEKKPDSMMVNLVMKTGLVKDPKQVNYVLIGIMVVFLILTIYIFKSAMGGSTASDVPPPVMGEMGAIPSGTNP